MKKNILKIVFSVIIGSFLLVSCSENKSTETTTTETHEGHMHESEKKTSEYYCSMKCEGEKTYSDKDAKCPMCGMELVKKE